MIGASLSTLVLAFYSLAKDLRFSIYYYSLAYLELAALEVPAVVESVYAAAGLSESVLNFYLPYVDAPISYLPFCGFIDFGWTFTRYSLTFGVLSDDGTPVQLATDCKAGGFILCLTYAASLGGSFLLLLFIFMIDRVAEEGAAAADVLA